MCKFRVAGSQDTTIPEINADLGFERLLDINLGDDAEALALDVSLIRRTASSKLIGRILLK